MSLLSALSLKTLIKCLAGFIPTAVPSAFAGVYGVKHTALSKELDSATIELNNSLAANGKIREETNKINKESSEQRRKSEEIVRQEKQESSRYQKQLEDLTEQLLHKYRSAIAQLEQQRESKAKLMHDSKNVDTCLALFYFSQTSEWCDDHLNKIYNNKVDYYWG